MGRSSNLKSLIQSNIFADIFQNFYIEKKRIIRGNTVFQKSTTHTHTNNYVMYEYY